MNWNVTAFVLHSFLKSFRKKSITFILLDNNESRLPAQSGFISTSICPSYSSCRSQTKRSRLMIPNTIYLVTFFLSKKTSFNQKEIFVIKGEKEVFWQELYQEMVHQRYIPLTAPLSFGNEHVRSVVTIDLPCLRLSLMERTRLERLNLC